MSRARGMNWLAELVAQEQGHQLYLLPTHSAQAAARHRALEAVARAANGSWCDFCDGYHSDVAADVAEWKKAGGRVCSEARALARLSRASRERSGR